MKILLLSVGTRGDMEPFLAIGSLLQRQGHEVICLFPEQFRPLAEESGFQFYSLGTEFIDLIQGDEGKLVMGGSGSFFRKATSYYRLYKASVSINKKMVSLQHRILRDENPDRVIYNGKATYPLVWGIENLGKTIMVSPVPYLIHPVDAHPHIGVKLDWGRWFNRLTYKLANYGLLQNILATTKEVREKKIGYRKIKTALASQKLIFTISPSLFKRPQSWPEHVHVLGYHQGDNKTNWSPEPALTDFLSRHEKPVFITFGSMTNPQPERKTKILLDALSALGIPAIFNTAAGGLREPRVYNSSMFLFVSQIPYEWIFPRVYSVIHHGGSGTTHMAVKSGCASMIIPHIIDQFVWNDILADMGLGPKGIRMGRLNEKWLIKNLASLHNQPEYKSKARQVAAVMQKEDYEEELLSVILNEGNETYGGPNYKD